MRAFPLFFYPLSLSICNVYLHAYIPLTYELEDCQKAVDYLTKYYGIRTMRIVLDGRKVGNEDEACYDENVAYFTKRGLNKSNVLHELYHHLAYVKNWEMPLRKEEREADTYARMGLKKA
jgi:hypothetical protein